MSIATRTKDPADNANIVLSWAAFLTSIGGPTISTSTWTVPAGITQVSATNTSTTTTIRLSGGTNGTDYELVNHVVLSDGQEYERAITVEVRSVESSVSTWSYDPTQLTTALNKVRFLIGDTVEGDPLIASDAEISFCLSEQGNNIYRAAAFACRRAAVQLIREFNLEGNPSTVYRQQQYKALMETAAQLDRDALTQGSAGVFAGGISESDVTTRRADPDRVVPAFTADAFTDVDPITDWDA